MGPSPTRSYRRKKPDVIEEWEDDKPGKMSLRSRPPKPKPSTSAAAGGQLVTRSRSRGEPRVILTRCQLDEQVYGGDVRARQTVPEAAAERSAKPEKVNKVIVPAAVQQVLKELKLVLTRCDGMTPEEYKNAVAAAQNGTEAADVQVAANEEASNGADAEKDNPSNDGNVVGALKELRLVLTRCDEMAPGEVNNAVTYAQKNGKGTVDLRVANNGTDAEKDNTSDDDDDDDDYSGDELTPEEANNAVTQAQNMKDAEKDNQSDAYNDVLHHSSEEMTSGEANNAVTRTQNREGAADLQVATNEEANNGTDAEKGNQSGDDNGDEMTSEQANNAVTRAENVEEDSDLQVAANEETSNGTDAEKGNQSDDDNGDEMTPEEANNAVTQAQNMKGAADLQDAANEEANNVTDAEKDKQSGDNVSSRVSLVPPKDVSEALAIIEEWVMPNQAFQESTMADFCVDNLEYLPAAPAVVNGPRDFLEFEIPNQDFHQANMREMEVGLGRLQPQNESEPDYAWRVCILWDSNILAKLEEHWNKWNGIKYSKISVAEMLSEDLIEENPDMNYAKPFMLLQLFGDCGWHNDRFSIRVAEMSTADNGHIPVKDRLYNLVLPDMRDNFALAEEVIRLSSHPTILMIWNFKLDKFKKPALASEESPDKILGFISLKEPKVDCIPAILIFHAELLSREKMLNIQGRFHESELKHFAKLPCEVERYTRSRMISKTNNRFVVHLSRPYKPSNTDIPRLEIEYLSENEVDDGESANSDEDNDLIIDEGAGADSDSRSTSGHVSEASMFEKSLEVIESADQPLCGESGTSKNSKKKNLQKVKTNKKGNASGIARDSQLNMLYTQDIETDGIQNGNRQDMNPVVVELSEEEEDPGCYQFTPLINQL